MKGASNKTCAQPDELNLNVEEEEVPWKDESFVKK